MSINSSSNQVLEHINDENYLFLHVFCIKCYFCTWKLVLFVDAAIFVSFLQFLLLLHYIIELVEFSSSDWDSLQTQKVFIRIHKVSLQLNELLLVYCFIFYINSLIQKCVINSSKNLQEIQLWEHILRNRCFRSVHSSSIQFWMNSISIKSKSTFPWKSYSMEIIFHDDSTIEFPSTFIGNLQKNYKKTQKNHLHSAELKKKLKRYSVH